MKIHLLIIDPQNDFCDPRGSLCVPGADADIKRLARMIDRLKGKLDDIHVTLDSHRKVDISHPIWWKDGSGAHPPPFTLISASDVADGRWTTALPSFHARSLRYLAGLHHRLSVPSGRGSVSASPHRAGLISGGHGEVRRGRPDGDRRAAGAI